jgi:hypothetical protein
MISDEARDWFALNRLRLALGCGGVLFICLALTGAFWGWNEWRIFSLRQRVERAVRASFPAFCTGPGEQMVINNALVRSSPTLVRNEMWDVFCRPGQGQLAWPWPAMTVNVVTCEVTTPMDISLKWYEVYGHLYINGQKLPVCP